jgi:hypothetical protein
METIINFADPDAPEQLRFNVEKFLLRQIVKGFEVDSKGIDLHLENGTILDKSARVQ